MSYTDGQSSFAHNPAHCARDSPPDGRNKVIVSISSGDYSESLTLSKAVSLTGALQSTTILPAVANTRVLTVLGAADSAVIISGLTFAGRHAVGGVCNATHGVSCRTQTADGSGARAVHPVEMLCEAL